MFKPIPPFKFKSMYDSFDNFKNFGRFHNFPNLKPIDPHMIKTYVPKSGEIFQGHAIASNSYSSNINGKISQGGHIVTILNDNGKVKEENIAF
ncbi:hypothetical protein HW555_001330 [Spodoptera exigua]|uniref:Uncharacterized protein n=1 Tax=Spodoptera exigua TaxID=7107 RepID=A0A835GSP2_SPOEX|nr:hypothetical protein HW555_001330 [Spodoptera exigua]